MLVVPKYYWIRNLLEIDWNLDITLMDMIFFLILSYSIHYAFSSFLLNTSKLDKFEINLALVDIMSFFPLIFLNNKYLYYYAHFLTMMINLVIVSCIIALLLHLVYSTISYKHWFVWSFATQFFSAYVIQMLDTLTTLRSFAFINVNWLLIIFVIYTFLIISQVKYLRKIVSDGGCK